MTLISLPTGEPHTDACLFNVRELANRALQYVTDWDDDEKYSLTAENYRDKLLPYVKAKEFFHCSADQSSQLSYSFNRYLEDIETSRIANWFETVLIYEGHNEELDFRHDGCAVVGFVNGFVRLVNKEQAASLIWKP